MASIAPTQQVASLPDDGPSVTPWGQLVSINPKYPNIDLVKDQHTFGRAPNNDTTYTDLGVSGNHARIFRERAGQGQDYIVWIEDTRYAEFYNTISICV